MKSQWGKGKVLKQKDEKKGLFFYIDGFHGGIRGHMPMGAWRDILNQLRRFPAWKVTLDIEPASWQALKQRDPQAFFELQQYLSGRTAAGRVEMVNGTLAQPYPWLIGGESVIRQFSRGLQVLHENFPGLKITTYATQEPCWTSCLPQILRSFGYQCAVLKNSTAFNGYTQGLDADLFHWVGPDGSRILAVPRYACENLSGICNFESLGAKPEFIRKCHERGIIFPAGMILQDLGWPAKPWVAGKYIRFTTWAEYLEHIKTQVNIPRQILSQEHFLGTLPWGQGTLQRLCQQVRAAENMLIVAEKMAALAWVFGKRSYPTAALQDAWEKTLWSQHHDVFAVTLHGDWAERAAAETYTACSACEGIINTACVSLAPAKKTQATYPLGRQAIRIFNSVAWPRAGLAELPLAADLRTEGFMVCDARGRRVPFQVETDRVYYSEKTLRQLSGCQSWMPWERSAREFAGDRFNAGRILFKAVAPAMGWTTYTVGPVYKKPLLKTAPQGAYAFKPGDGIIAIVSDCYRLEIDPARGGIIKRFFAKKLNREICDNTSPYQFNEYRGYFIKEKAWATSTAQAARVEILENGPVRVRVRIEGRVAAVPFQTSLTVVQGEPRLDFDVEFDFGRECRIGDPFTISEHRYWESRRSSSYADRYKLQALFPVAGKIDALYKSAAYDVCQSRNDSTVYNSWDALRHNVINNWVDVFDQTADCGLALFSGHVASYGYGPDQPLALTLAWGAQGGVHWRHCPLTGKQKAHYAILPHEGRWDRARLWQAAATWAEPLRTMLMSAPAKQNSKVMSFIKIENNAFDVPAIYVEKGNLIVRLFNAEGDDVPKRISLAVRPTRADLVELDGRLIKRLEIKKCRDDRYAIELAMPHFGVRTVRLSGIRL